MPTMRYFIVEDENLISLFEQWKSERDKHIENCKIWLDEWGSQEIAKSGFRHNNIIGLKDPTTFGKPKPKGWVKLKLANGFICPSQSNTTAAEEAREYLKKFQIRTEIEATGIILNYIYNLNEVNKKKLGQGSNFDKLNGDHQWLYEGDGGMYCGGIGYSCYNGKWFVKIPDVSLQYESVPGIKEIFEWQYRDMVDESLALQTV